MDILPISGESPRGWGLFSHHAAVTFPALVANVICFVKNLDVMIHSHRARFSHDSNSNRNDYSEWEICQWWLNLEMASLWNDVERWVLLVPDAEGMAATVTLTTLAAPKWLITFINYRHFDLRRPWSFVHRNTFSFKKIKPLLCIRWSGASLHPL